MSPHEHAHCATSSSIVASVRGMQNNFEISITNNNLDSSCRDESHARELELTSVARMPRVRPSRVMGRRAGRAEQIRPLLAPGERMGDGGALAMGGAAAASRARLVKYKGVLSVCVVFGE